MVFYKMDLIEKTDPQYIKKEKKLKEYTDWSRVPAEAIDQQIRLAVVLDEYVNELKPDALAIRCWTEFQELRNISPCAAISYLNHTGISTACEVDLGNAITMAAMRKISKDAVACQDWNNNWKEVDDKFMFMHCGPHDISWLKPGTYVDTHRILDNSFGKYTGYGCIQGRFKSTIFTYGSCSSEDGVLKFYIGTGEVTDDELPDNYFGSGGAAVIKGLQKVLLHVGYNGYKHHFSMTRGDIADQLITELRKHHGFKVTDMRKVT